MQARVLGAPVFGELRVHRVPEALDNGDGPQWIAPLGVGVRF